MTECQREEAQTARPQETHPDSGRLQSSYYPAIQCTVVFVFPRKTGRGVAGSLKLFDPPPKEKHCRLLRLSRIYSYQLGLFSTIRVKFKVTATVHDSHLYVN
jgi:hypothetical protein